MTTQPACRFGLFGLKQRCNVHGNRDPSDDICDIGLAALYEEIASLKHYKAMTENQLVVYEKHEASPEFIALRAQLEAASDAYKAGYRKAQEELGATVEEQARVIGRLRGLWNEGIPMHNEEGDVCKGCEWEKAMEEALSPKEA